MAIKFKSTININDEYTLPLTDGSAGQVMATDGNGGIYFQTLSTPENVDESDLVYYVCKNSSGSTIAKGVGVMAVGTDGNSGHILIAPMVADGSVEPIYYLGVTSESIGNGNTGRVIHFGEISHINTNSFEDGDILWCDPVNPGGFTTTEPLGPNLKISSVIVLNSSTNGKIRVRVQGNEGLHELHDVRLVSESDKDMLVWNSTLNVWENTKTLGNISTGNITTSGTVDGVDISLFKSSYDSHNHDDRYYTETEIDTFLTNKTNWDTAYSWGDHSIAGYLTSYDLPTGLVYLDNFTGNSTAVNFTLSQIPDDEVTVQVYFDGVYQSKGNYSVASDVITFSTAPPTGTSIEVITFTKFSATAGYLTSESDPVFTASPAGGITGTQVTNWDASYGWGDHALAGYSNDYTISYISADTTAVADNMYVFTATLTLTLPATPAEGDKVAISNMSGTTTPIIARNGSNIAGLAEDLTIDINNVGIQFVYTGASKGWILI